MERTRSQRLLVTLNWVVLVVSVIVAGYGLTERAKSEVVIEWSTASELNTSGFNLYRSNQRDGEFIKVNAEIIPASTDPLLGGEYTFKDGDVQPGITYYYELEEIEFGGKSSRHGPIEVKAIAGGTSEILLAIILAAVSALGLLSLRPTKINEDVHGN